MQEVLCTSGSLCGCDVLGHSKTDRDTVKADYCGAAVCCDNTTTIVFINE